MDSVCNPWVRGATRPRSFCQRSPTQAAQTERPHARQRWMASGATWEKPARLIVRPAPFVQRCDPPCPPFGSLVLPPQASPALPLDGKTTCAFVYRRRRVAPANLTAVDR